MWILIIIIIILLALLYKFYSAKFALLQVCQGFLQKIAEKEEYLFLTNEQIPCTPNRLRGQTNKLIREISENKTADVEDFMRDSNSRLLLLLHQPVNTKYKMVVGLLKICLLNECQNTSVLAGKVADNPIYISSVIIDQRFRGQGFGGKMLQILFDMLKKDTILEVKKINTPAIKLYRKLGFNIIDQNANIYLMRRFK